MGPVVGNFPGDLVNESLTRGVGVLGGCSEAATEAKVERQFLGGVEAVYARLS